MLYGQTAWVGFIVPHLKWRSQEWQFPRNFVNKAMSLVRLNWGCVLASCGETDLVGFVVLQYKWKSPENVCRCSGVGEKSGNFREISLINA